MMTRVEVSQPQSSHRDLCPPPTGPVGSGCLVTQGRQPGGPVDFVQTFDAIGAADGVDVLNYLTHF